jgi:hypothetical protein
MVSGGLGVLAGHIPFFFPLFFASVPFFAFWGRRSGRVSWGDFGCGQGTPPLSFCRSIVARGIGTAATQRRQEEEEEDGGKRSGLRWRPGVGLGMGCRGRGRQCRMGRRGGEAWRRTWRCALVEEEERDGGTLEDETLCGGGQSELSG